MLRLCALPKPQSEMVVDCLRDGSAALAAARMLCGQIRARASAEGLEKKQAKAAARLAEREEKKARDKLERKAAVAERRAARKLGRAKALES